MRAVLRKMAADLAGRPWQSSLIVLTVAAAAALLYLGLAVLSATSGPYDKQHARADGAHAWFYLTGGEKGDELAARIAAMPEVLAATPVRPRWTTKLVLTPEKSPRIDVAAMAPGPQEFDRYLVVQGRVLEAGDAGDGVLDASYAQFHGIKVGDQVSVATLSGPRTVTVVGLMAEPRICVYPSCQGVHLYVLPETFASLTEGVKKSYVGFGVKLKDPAAADKFIVAAKRLENADAKVLDALSWLRIRSIYRSENALTVSLILVVGTTAILAAALIIANIIGGAVLGQFREIGVLKAVGYTPGQVLQLFVGQNLVLALAGGAVGVGAGHLLARRMLAAQSFSMGDPDLLRFKVGVAGLVVLAVTLVGAVFAALAAWRAVAVRPSEALAGGVDRPRARVPLAARILTALRVPVPAVLGVKDVTARPARMLLTMLSLGICLVTLAISLGANSLFGRVLQDPAFVGMNFDLQMSAGLMPPEEAERAVASEEAIDAYYSVAYRAGVLSDFDDNFYIRALGGDWERFSFPITAGRMIQGPDELVLGPVIAERHGLKVGQKVRIRVDGKDREVTLVGTYRAPDEGGATGMITLETLRQLAPDQKAGNFFAKVAAGTTPEGARQALLRQTDHKLDVVVAVLQVPPWLVEALDMIKLLAFLMAGIAGLSVLNTALLTTREQMREAGIRKAIGMTPAQIMAGAGAGGLWLGLMGAVIGVPGGAYVYKVLVDTMGRVTGIGELDGRLTWPYALAMVLISMGLAVVAALPAALWAGRLPTARVLYSE